MHDPATLELNIRSWPDSTYTVEPRFYLPGSEYGQRPYTGSSLPPFPLDLVKLRERWGDPDAYGQALAAMLFHDRRVGEALAMARASAAVAEVPLRLRLRLDPTNPNLHAIAWELLHDVHGGGPISVQEQLRFSRYSDPKLDLEPANRALPKRPLILVAIANPSGLGKYQLGPIDVESEIARVQKIFGDTNLRLLVARPEEGYVTFTRLMEQLHVGADVLYLVCHGSKHRETWDLRLWLEDDRGEPDPISADRLVQRLQSLDHKPRLIALTACQAAGNLDETWILGALGSRLIEAGCPAVIASQGNLSMQTADAFFPVFFRMLFEHGQIERAVASARATCLNLSDWWRPVLYSQVSDDYLWRPDPRDGLFAGVPQSPAFYVGREQDESRIAALLRQHDGQPINIYGLPGTGKTSLVATVVERLRQERCAGDAVLWGDFSSHSLSEQLWAFVFATNGRRSDVERIDTLRDAFWRELASHFHHPLVVLDNVDSAARAADFLPNNVPPNCRVVLISVEQLRFVDRPDPLALPIAALDDDVVQRLFQRVLGAHYREEYQSEFTEIGRLRGALPQLVLIDALHMLHAQVRPDVYRAELERNEQELRLGDSSYQTQLDQAVLSLSPTQVQLFELIGLLGEGSWGAGLLAAATLRIVAETEADLETLVNHGLISAVDHDRYAANRLMRNYIRSRLERYGAHELQLAKYLFVRACLDLLADHYERISSTLTKHDDLVLTPGIARALVQQLSEKILPELVHLRQALIWAEQHPGWRLMERFAQLAWSELLDDVTSNAQEITANIALATLRRPIFWYAGTWLQVRGRAALVSRPVIMRHPGTKSPLEIRDSYQYNIGDRLVWPRVGQQISLGEHRHPELSLQLQASRLVDAIICGYRFVESRWMGVLAERLLLRDDDMVAAIWTNCDLRASFWLHCDARQIDLTGCRLEGAVFDQVELRGAKLKGVDLRGAVLRECDLRGADLTDADLRGADLYSIDLRGALLIGAQLDGAHIEEVRLQGSKLEGSSWRGVQGLPEIDHPDILRRMMHQIEVHPRLSTVPERPPRPTAMMITDNPRGEYHQSDLRGIDLANQTIVLEAPERLRLDEADLSAAKLHGATLPWIGLQGAKLRAADLHDADLTRADLRGADLQVALLNDTVLRHADLRTANLQAARLHNADLCDADCRDADLLGADLSNAIFTGAQLERTNLSWADLRGACVEPEQLAAAARLAYAKITVNNVTKDIKEFPGRYAKAKEGFDQAAFLRFSVCSGAFDQWNLEDRDMFGAQLCGTFTDLSLARSQLTRARLSGAFVRVCFCTAQFESAELSGDFSAVQFQDALLRKAYLSGTFRDVSFHHADFTDCTIAGASFVGVSFVDAIGLDLDQLRNAVRLCGSILPDGRRYGGELDLPGDDEDARQQGFDLGDPVARAQFFGHNGDLQKMHMCAIFDELDVGSSMGQ